MLKRNTLLSTLALCFITSILLAQESTTKKEPPKTKLGQFEAQNGVVIVQGFTTVGTAKGMYNTSIAVDAKELFNAVTGKKEYGITIEVKENRSSGISRENTSYVDYDEIESLVKGFDYISKLDKSSTKLADFQATYSTKDDLSLSTYSGASLSAFSSSKSGLYLSVKSGSIGSASAIFKQEDVSQVRELIVKAKTAIDGIK